MLLSPSRSAETSGTPPKNIPATPSTSPGKVMFLSLSMSAASLQSPPRSSPSELVEALLVPHLQVSQASFRPSPSASPGPPQAAVVGLLADEVGFVPRAHSAPSS